MCLLSIIKDKFFFHKIAKPVIFLNIKNMQNYEKKEDVYAYDISIYDFMRGRAGRRSRTTFSLHISSGYWFRLKTKRQCFYRSIFIKEKNSRTINIDKINIQIASPNKSINIPNYFEWCSKICHMRHFKQKQQFAIKHKKALSEK